LFQSIDLTIPDLFPHQQAMHLFLSGYVSLVQFGQINEYSYFALFHVKASVRPSLSHCAMMYVSSNSVCLGKCTCENGASEQCCHAEARLLTLQAVRDHILPIHWCNEHSECSVDKQTEVIPFLLIYHTTKKRYYCSPCSCEFINHAAYAAHVLTHKTSEVQLSSSSAHLLSHPIFHPLHVSPSLPEVVAVTMCDPSFKQKRQGNEEREDQECPVCHKKYKRLATHMKVHVS
jgi:hypothetical protein